MRKVNHKRMKDIQIKNLCEHTEQIPLLAKWHYRQWGDLTGASSQHDYQKLLSTHAFSQCIPMTLLALNGNRLLGSVNIVESDLDMRPELTPWLAQLYVAPEQRGRGIGSTLVRAAVARTTDLGFDALYLYTSGALPIFYESMGWTTRETVQYKGKDRTVMELKLPVNILLQGASRGSAPSGP
jgi:GNAT superfamily N-acetyltransferase